jgi:nicotinate-nucleotide adenylyltransferase
MGRRGLSGAGGSKQRFGVLGGIFDPIHYAHLAMAEQARAELDLAGVLFVPAGQPVHREAPRASADDRLKMIELGIADNPAFAASRVEIDRPEPGYMVDTLEALRGHDTGPHLVLIASAETVALMPTTWSRMDRVLELAEVAVVSREGYPDIDVGWLAKSFPGQAERFMLLRTSRLGHSSTEIRARLAAGKTIRYLVPAAVENYIREKGLYGG